MGKMKRQYGVMTVVNFHTTIKEEEKEEEEEKKLFPGDIILSMEGTDLGGKTFTEACQLFPKVAAAGGRSSTTPFGNNDNDDNNKIITCTMTVAREKKVVKILS